MKPFAQVNPITDICFLVDDCERSIPFYTDKLGFRLRRRAPGFADFAGAGVTLALWEIGHIAEYTGISPLRSPPHLHKACGAFELASPAHVDEAYAELLARGVTFQRPPEDYVWNARCCYFADPDDNIWELYAWLDGGPVGDLGLTD